MASEFQLTFCFISGLCCLLPVCLRATSYLEDRPLRVSINDNPEFRCSCVASVSLSLPLIFDVLFDFIFTARNSLTGGDAKKDIPDSHKFNFLNTSERLLTLMGVIVLPLVGFLPIETENLALIYICCGKCQQTWVGGAVALSLSRYDKEYWSIETTSLCLVFFTLGLVTSAFIDNEYAQHTPPSFRVFLIDRISFLITIVPCMIFIVNSSRWLIIVYFRMTGIKRYLMCTCSKPGTTQASETPAVLSSKTVDHTFFPMVYTLCGITVIILLLFLVGSTDRAENYTRHNLVQNNAPFLVFVFLISTLSMRLVKFEVVQGLVSPTHKYSVT